MNVIKVENYPDNPTFVIPQGRQWDRLRETDEQKGLCLYKALHNYNTYEGLDFQLGNVFKRVEKSGLFMPIYLYHVWLQDTAISNLILDDLDTLTECAEEDGMIPYLGKVVMEDAVKWKGKSMQEVIKILGKKYKPKSNVETVYVKGMLVNKLHSGMTWDFIPELTEEQISDGQNRLIDMLNG